MPVARHELPLKPSGNNNPNIGITTQPAHRNGTSGPISASRGADVLSRSIQQSLQAEGYTVAEKSVRIQVARLLAPAEE